MPYPQLPKTVGTFRPLELGLYSAGPRIQPERVCCGSGRIICLPRRVFLACCRTPGVRRAWKRKRGTSERWQPSPGRVEDWRACWRWRVSSPALSSAGWVHNSPVATVPTPATSNRTCGAPAYGFPTPFFQRRSRSRAASASRGDVVESTRAGQCLELVGRSAPLQACLSPWHHTLSPLSVPVLKRLGRVAHADGVAPPSKARVAFGHHCRQGSPQAAPFGRLPPVAPDGFHGFWAGPQAWAQRPRLPCSAGMEVEPETLTPGSRHVDDTRLGGRPGQFALRQDLRDGRQGWLGLASRAADHHHVVRLPREVTQRAIRRCPVHLQHLSGDVGPHRAADAPSG